MEVKQRYGFGDILTRWMIWFSIFVVAYWGYQAILLALNGRGAEGLIKFVLGVATDIVMALGVAVVIAVLARWIHWRREPYSHKNAAIIAVILGVILGQTGYNANAQSLADRCEKGIDTKFNIVENVLHKSGSTTAALSSYRPQIDALWNPPLDCDSVDTKLLTDTSRGKYLDILLIGNYESVVVYYSTKQYDLARSHLTGYQKDAHDMRPIAIEKHWSGWLEFEKTATKQMTNYDSFLKKLGH